jgi:hypothetical protein
MHEKYHKKIGKSPLISKIEPAVRLDLKERDVRFAALARQCQNLYVFFQDALIRTQEFAP